MLSTCCFAQNSMYVTYDKNIDPHKLGMVKAVTSKYEWKGITQRITANCRTERQKAHAITGIFATTFPTTPTIRYIMQTSVGRRRKVCAMLIANCSI